MLKNWLKKKKLRELGEIHTLVAVLSTPKIVCFGNRSRPIDRLFLDMPDKSQAHIRNIVGRAEQMGVVQIKRIKYLQRYIEYVTLSAKGVLVANIFQKKEQ